MIEKSDFVWKYNHARNIGQCDVVNIRTAGTRTLTVTFKDKDDGSDCKDDDVVVQKVTIERI